MLVVYIHILHPLIFNVCFLYLKWTSYRQHVVGSCLFIQSDNLYLLTGEFSPLTFSVIITVARLRSTILLFAFCLFLVHKRLYLLEQFWVHNKIEQEIREVSYTQHPYTSRASPAVKVLPQRGTLMNLRWHITVASSPYLHQGHSCCWALANAWHYSWI